ncbi:MAG: polysaccharide export protein EpsE [Pseudomonadota bacterium]
MEIGFENALAVVLLRRIGNGESTMKKFWRSVLVTCVCLLASPVWSADSDYRMGTGDVLRITVYGQPDLTTEARVSESGSITFPLIGEVKMSGVTPAQGQAEIAQRLAKGGFILDPFVTVNVVQYRGQQISVLGRVNRPGKYNLERASRVTDVLALAGGVVPDGADVATLIRERDGKTEYREIDLVALFREGGEAANERVQDGDILNVARQPVFYIYGEVQRPGAFRLEQNMSVVQALSLGGGVTPRGTQRGIRILRRDAGGAMKEIQVRLDDPVKKDDVIYVKESLF